MQNSIQKFRQRSIVFVKPGILSENLETDEHQLPYSSIFFAETLHSFPTYQCPQKGVRDFFNFVYLDLELFAEIKKDLVSTHSFFTLLIITQDLNEF